MVKDGSGFRLNHNSNVSQLSFVVICQPGKIVQNRVSGFGFAFCVYCKNETSNTSPTVLKLRLNEIMSNKGF